MKLKETILMIMCLVTLLFIFNCSNSDDSSTVTDPVNNDNPVEILLNAPFNLVLLDHGNVGNTTDLYISFIPNNSINAVSEYRLYIFKAGAQIPDIDSIESSTHFTALGDSSNLTETQIDAVFNDFDGDAIINDTNYKSIILVKSGAEGFLSNKSSSTSFMLEDKAYFDVETLGVISGNEALTYNPIDNFIYTPATGSLLKMDVNTGQTEVVGPNLNAEGPLGGSFDATYENFYLSFFNTDEVRRYDDNGNWDLITSGVPGPTGIAIDSNNDLYVSSYWTPTIYKVNIADGTKTVYATSPLFNGLDGLVWVGSDLYVANFDDSNIMKVIPDGTVTLFATLPSSASFFTGYITYADNTFYVASGHKLYSIDMSGTVTHIAGTSSTGDKDGPGLLAQFQGAQLGVNGVAATTAGDTIFLGTAGKIKMLIKRQ